MPRPGCLTGSRECEASASQVHQIVRQVVKILGRQHNGSDEQTMHAERGEGELRVLVDGAHDVVVRSDKTGLRAEGVLGHAGDVLSHRNGGRFEGVEDGHFVEWRLGQLIVDGNVGLNSSRKNGDQCRARGDQREVDGRRGGGGLDCRGRLDSVCRHGG
ncbi:hypothetical protein FGB62_228g011 [Gracilaria domingensis]|nr:hypothetical protein FGB62_228g011 [Gracilaria domingensis]